MRPLLVAVFELARARWRLGRHSARALIELSRRQGRPRCPARGRGPGRPRGLRDPRVAARIPWRADCWIQALAAQSRFARGRVSSEIWIGVRQDRASGFAAHAWLLQGGHPVTGGDATGYVPLVKLDTEL